VLAEEEANIVDVSHERMSLALNPKRAALGLDVECRDAEKVLATLRKHALYVTARVVARDSNLGGDGRRLCLVGGQEEARQPDIRETPEVLEDGEHRALRQRAQFDLDNLNSGIPAGSDRERHCVMIADDFEDSAEDQGAFLGLDDELCHVRAVDLGEFGRLGKGYQWSIVLLDHVPPCCEVRATDQAHALDYMTQQVGMSGALGEFLYSANSGHNVGIVILLWDSNHFTRKNSGHYPGHPHMEND
jgi:hypothetical protein